MESSIDDTVHDSSSKIYDKNIDGKLEKGVTR